MYNINSKLYNLFVMEESVQYGIGMPHDRLFKDILNDKEEFCDFINRFANKNGDNKLFPESLEKVTTSFITPVFKNKESDILYKRIDEEKYYLVEHQSTIDDSMSFRMINYCINILNDITEHNKLKNKEYKIPKIIPIVLYTGEKKWNCSTKLTDKQETLDSEGTLIELKYKLIDINKIKEEELLKANTSLAYGMLIEKNRGKENLIKILNKIAKNCNKEEKEIKMKRIIKYILEPILGEDETSNMLQKFNKMGGEEIMTAIDYLIKDIEEEKRRARIEGMEKGIKRGREKGREEGEKKAMLDISKELLKIGMDVEKISKITGLSKSEIVV